MQRSRTAAERHLIDLPPSAQSPARLTEPALSHCPALGARLTEPALSQCSTNARGAAPSA